MHISIIDLTLNFCFPILLQVTPNSMNLFDIVVISHLFLLGVNEVR